MLRSLTAALGLAVSLLVAAPLAGPAQAAAAAPGCAPWAQQQVAGGLGILENLAFDGRGGLLVSNQGLGLGPGAIERLDPAGRRTVVVPGVTGPGGLVVWGDTLWFNAGNSVVDGLLGLRNGTVVRRNLATGASTTLASGLLMPNGLTRLPDGSLLASSDLGPGQIIRIAPDGKQSVYAPSITSTNGMAYDAGRQLLYVSSTFTATTTISVVDVRRPEAAPRVITLPGIGPLNSADDLTLGPDGFLYVPLNVAGLIVRVDPASGTTCTVASGLPFVSSVRFGAGPGWDARSLYAVTFLGSVTRLTPG